MALIQLAPRARQTLRRIVRSNADAREVRRAQALLWLDQHESAAQVAKRIGRTRQAIYRIVARYQARQGMSVAERLRDQPRRGRPGVKRQRTLTVIQALLTQSPARYRYRTPVWTVPMLRHQVQRRLKCTVSARTVRRALHQLRQRFKRPRHVLAQRPATWRQSKGGLKTGLKRRPRTVILFLDSTIFSEVPPLRAMWAPIGQQAQVPILGSHDRRFLTGVLNLKTGEYIDYISTKFHQEQFQAVLRQIRSHWRGWRIVLFLDRNTAHKAHRSRRLARDLAIQLRWLPTACSELNVLDQLWGHVKDEVAANEPLPNVDATVRRARGYVHSLPRQERLRKAGVLSPDFWLTDVLK